MIFLKSNRAAVVLLALAGVCLALGRMARGKRDRIPQGGQYLYGVYRPWVS